MDVLSKITARQIIHYGVSEMLLTIMTCYTIAVALGHVPAWLPMISDCAVKPPEMYLFRLGVVFGASLLALQAVTVYYANKERPLSSLNAVLALVASISIGIVGVVNEKEDDSVHSFFAVLFFICYDVYMVLSVLTTITRKPSNCTGFGLTIAVSSFIIKTICAIIGVITGTGYTLGIFSFISVGGSIALAMFEWANTFTIMGFIWSYLLDNFLTGVDIFEVRVSSEKDSEKPQEMNKLLP
ncbi:PREDICTED: DNA damage-regulated autophagy modulator protein 1-like [Amphimedon queenslandica]|uniref:CWH43-like N-terminal domain-containing protein n=1 Tax=Amphimedon queenslandica TaxID=400682 RepID=A0A1X7TEV1_AMPQE|nr:PREDICTED: DNA damage-regulated autophagy modulator protein 1-like [Amphimedon queenslandica]|eukprot:XP_019859948.1 PREDICTED: DNA damage-regulated autophagy modulator protein 1-like [Amphimedon queenslandica]